MHKVITGDCLEVLKGMPDNSVDSLVCDPPAGISFAGKSWDSDRGSRIAWMRWLTAILKESLRVLKPGAHGAVWSIPRTSHWTGMSIELAGFEIRDTIEHLFGSGFPKNHNISKSIEKAAGVKPIATVKADLGMANNPDWNSLKHRHIMPELQTDAAKAWDGYGTALKPSKETWWVVRKPLEKNKTIVDTILEHGTGAMNIDGCRVKYEDGDDLKGKVIKVRNNGKIYGGDSFLESCTLGDPDGIPANDIGRWPPNFVMSHAYFCSDEECVVGCPVKELDEQSGHLVSAASKEARKQSPNAWFGGGDYGPHNQIGDSGGASRFFPQFRYCAKPGKYEKEQGLSRDQKVRHPTVKPISFMRWLCRLVTPKHGTVLDPFCGSGTTGCGAVLEEFSFIGIEMEVAYAELSRNRIKWWSTKTERQVDKHEEIGEDGQPLQMGFDFNSDEEFVPF